MTTSPHPPKPRPAPEPGRRAGPHRRQPVRVVVAGARFDGAGGCSRGAAAQGKPAPDFVPPDANGKLVRLSELRGQVVLVNLWATWCPPCIAEMPDLAAIYNAHKAEGLVILGVNDQERKETVLGFLAHNALPYPILLDPDSRVARAYGVGFLPASFLIDRRGVLRTTLTGQTHRAKLEVALKPLLAEKP